jgi:transcriptional regulator with XRE-family HTH domain
MKKNKGDVFMKRNIVINNEVLRKTRKAMEITQEDMANNLGVTRKTYERYEKERAYLSKDTVMQIASLLNTEYDMLVLLDIEKEIERIENYPLEKLKERLHL